MDQKYDVVIVGGGVLGCAVAYHVCRRSDLRVALIERGMVGMQATSMAASLVTRARPTREQTLLEFETFRAVEDLENLLGEDLDFRHVGSLHVAETPENAQAIADQTAMLRDMGDEPQELSLPAAQEKAPWLTVDQAELIVFNPLDGFIDGYRLAAAFLRGAKACGNLEVYQSTSVNNLISQGGQVVGVETSKGTVWSEQTVLASGAWINVLLEPLDSGVPMAPVRSHYWITGKHDSYLETCPVTILPDARAYARPEVGGLLFGLRDMDSKWAHPKNLPDSLQGFAFDEDFDGWSALEQTVEPFLERCPSLSDVEIQHYISGPSGYTPDGKYAIGPAPNLDGVFVVSGCCGAGVSISGGAGAVMASLLLGERPTIDLSAYRPNRFGAFDPFDEGFLASCARSRSQKKAG